MWYAQEYRLGREARDFGDPFPRNESGACIAGWEDRNEEYEAAERKFGGDMLNLLVEDIEND